MPASEQIDAVLRSWPRAVRVAPQFMRPIHDIAFRVKACAQVYQHGGAVWLPRELIVAHPLQLYRPPGCGACDQRGVERNVIGAIVTITARSLRVHRGNLVLLYF